MILAGFGVGFLSLGMDPVDSCVSVVASLDEMVVSVVHVWVSSYR